MSVSASEIWRALYDRVLGLITRMNLANLSSGAATEGQVATADGAGGVDWEDPAGGAVDAENVTFTPAVLTNWTGNADPGNANDALDQLAARTTVLEGATPTLVQHAQIVFTIEGAYLAASYQGVKPLRIPLPYVGAGGTIEEVYCRLNTAPGSAALRLDIHKDGSTIFTGTEYVEIAVAGYTVSRTTNFAGGGAITKDSYFQLELVQGDAVAADLVVCLRYKWTLTGG